jgi:hypothetical protein
MERIMKRLYLSCLSKVLKLALLVVPSVCFAEEVIECESYFTINYPDRYIVNETRGTVIDRVTGLMWDRCYYGLTGENCEYLLSDSAQLADPDTALVEVTYGTPAQHFANTNQANRDNYRGYNDWYMPNIKELAALADAGCVSYYQEEGSDVKHIVSQPARIFPLLSSLYKQSDFESNYILSSTPFDRNRPGDRLVFSLSTTRYVTFQSALSVASGVVRRLLPYSIVNYSAQIPTEYNLKLVRKVQKSEFDVPLTPATIVTP